MCMETRMLLKEVEQLFGSRTKWRLMVQNPCVPKLYGLPKTHKNPLKMRPIISNCNSPLEKLAKWVTEEWKKLKPPQGLFVKNSFDFLERIRNIRIEEDEILISFDVESLYPSIPIPETMDLLKIWLNETEPDERKREVYHKIASTCMNWNCCSFNDIFYKIEEGTSMGNSLSPFLANLFMSNLESNLQKESDFPKIWLRYVDDIFAIIKKNDIDGMLHKLNNKHPKIHFTHEVEQDKCIPFLDMCIHRKGDKSLEVSVYRKPTNVPRYIPSDSFCPIQHKKAAFNSMVYRLCKFPLNAKSYMEELKYIKYTANINGYNETMIDSLVNKLSKRIRRENVTTLGTSNLTNSNRRMKICFYPTITNKLKKVFNKQNIDLVFANDGKLKHLLGSTKDKTPKEMKSGIYKIECNECSEIYIGQTSRNIKTRYEEHESHIKKNRPTKSAVALHVIENQHVCTIENLTLVKQVNNKRKLDAYESIYMHKHNSILMNTMEAPIMSNLIKLT